MTRAIIVAALLLVGATAPLLVADAASANEPVPDPIWRTVDSGADLVLSRPTFCFITINAVYSASVSDSTAVVTRRLLRSVRTQAPALSRVASSP